MPRCQSQLPGGSDAPNLREVMSDPSLFGRFGEAFDHVGSPALAAQYVLNKSPTLKIVQRMLASTTFVPSALLTHRALVKGVSEDGVLAIFQRCGVDPMLRQTDIRIADSLGYARVVTALTPPAALPAIAPAPPAAPVVVVDSLSPAATGG